MEVLGRRRPRVITVRAGVGRSAALRRLQAMGLIYPAFMSRGEVEAAIAGRDWPRDPDGTPLYPGNDRDLEPKQA